mgnify:CR=1 FL=1
MDSFRILGSLSILLVVSGLLAGCSQSKLESGDSPVVRTDLQDGGEVVSQQEQAVASQVTKTTTEAADVQKSDEPLKSGEKPLPSDDPTQRKPDISLAKEVLDWSPQVELEEGLERTIPHFRALLES